MLRSSYNRDYSENFNQSHEMNSRIHYRAGGTVETLTTTKILASKSKLFNIHQFKRPRVRAAASREISEI